MWKTKDTQIGEISEFKAKFPIGIYYIGTPSAAEVDVIADVGFDHLAFRVNPNASSTVNQCKARNLGIVCENENAGFQELVTLYGLDPFVGFFVADDIHDKTAAELNAAKAVINGLGGTAVGSSGSPNSSNLSIPDVAAQQWYPVTSEDIFESSEYYFPRALAQAGNRPLMANVQTFAWNNQRYPTPDELEAMLWLATHYCSGITCYTWHDNANDLVTRPKLVEVLTHFISNVRDNEDKILAGSTLVKEGNLITLVFGGSYTKVIERMEILRVVYAIS